MKSIGWYFLAALGEINGCFAFWAWLRLGNSPFWALPGAASLVFFAVALTRVDSAAAGRTYAGYGGIYIVASLVWLWAIERIQPDRWDVLGSSICILGMAVILFSPRAAAP